MQSKTVCGTHTHTYVFISGACVWLWFSVFVGDCAVGVPCVCRVCCVCCMVLWLLCLCAVVVWCVVWCRVIVVSVDCCVLCLTRARWLIVSILCCDWCACYVGSVACLWVVLWWYGVRVESVISRQCVVSWMSVTCVLLLCVPCGDCLHCVSLPWWCVMYAARIVHAS